MTTRKTSGTRVYQATQSFAFTNTEGETVRVQAGQRYREGHPFIDGREAYFKLDDEIIEVPEG